MNQTLKALLAISFIAVIISGVMYLNSALDQPKLMNKTVMGVTVYSKINLSIFMDQKVLGLHLNNGTAERTCNFELSSTALSVDPKGYDVQIQRKPMGIFLDRKGALIMGETDDEMLQACHAFLCLRDNISCPNNLMDARELYLKNTDMVIVLDNRSGSAGIRGFTELLAELGYLQAKLADTDKDGIVEANEIKNNTYHIYPYIMDGNDCVLQEFNNALQSFNITNDTAPCSDFTSGIFISPSTHNRIEIEGRKILIYGDEDHLFTECVIVRDIIEPEWIRAYYQLD
jgi:hypothetical protein